MRQEKLCAPHTCRGRPPRATCRADRPRPSEGRLTLAEGAVALRCAPQGTSPECAVSVSATPVRRSWSGGWNPHKHLQRALLAQLVEHFHGKRVRRPVPPTRRGRRRIRLVCSGSLQPSRHSSSRRLHSDFAVLRHRVQYQRSMGAGAAPPRRERQSRRVEKPVRAANPHATVATAVLSVRNRLAVGAMAAIRPPPRQKARSRLNARHQNSAIRSSDRIRPLAHKGGPTARRKNRAPPILRLHTGRRRVRIPRPGLR